MNKPQVPDTDDGWRPDNSKASLQVENGGVGKMSRILNMIVID